MKIQTFAIIAGTNVCNARCPFCVSKMTPAQGVLAKAPEINFRNFRKACLFAKSCGTNTVMFTGKGEPTLFPEQISGYLDALQEFNFPFIELQTNGILFYEQKEKYLPFLKDWYNKGMTTIAISVVHFDANKNKEIYLPNKKEYINLEALISLLHDNKFSVRLVCMLADGFIDSAGKLKELIAFAKKNTVEQLSLRPINKPVSSLSIPAEDWVTKNFLKDAQIKDIKEFLSLKGKKLLEFSYGAIVYDISGQNVCLTNCLTEPDGNDLRHLIFFPDGHLRYDWQYEGAILL